MLWLLDAHTLLQFTVLFHLQISAAVCFSLYNNDNMLLEKDKQGNKIEERPENWKTVHVYSKKPI